MKPQSSFLLACVLFVLFNLSPLHNLWGLFLPKWRMFPGTILIVLFIYLLHKRTKNLKSTDTCLQPQRLLDKAQLHKPLFGTVIKTKQDRQMCGGRDMFNTILFYFL